MKSTFLNSNHKQLPLLFFIFLLYFTSNATTIYTVGSSSDNYTTIASAYTACSGSTDYILEIQSDYDYNTESTTGSVTISLGILANKSSTNTVTIRPASGATLSFTGTVSSLFTISAANWVIFDGRAAGIGTSALTLINSSSSASKRVFTFINDASNNVIKYCLIKGDNSSIASGTAGLILFSTTSGTTGNDSNTIDNCTIQQNTSNPGCLIQSTGTSAKTNSSNTISNCNLVNASTYSIWVDTYSDTWSITGNSFYQSASQTPTANVQVISVNTGTGHTITGNFIGGQASSCGGSAFTLTNSAFTFTGIYVSGSSGTTHTISNNSIKNINFTSTASGSSSAGTCTFIYAGGTGNYTIGSSGNGNTIGSTSGTSNIVIAINSSSAYQGIVFFNCVSTGTISVDYNTVGAVAFTNTTNCVGNDIYFVFVQNTGATTITNNTFGNSTANNITSTNKSWGITCITKTTGANSLTVTSNTFQNATITNVGGTSGDGQILFLRFNCSSANLTINSNTIKNISFYYDTDDNAAGASSAIIYMQNAGTTCSIYDNTIQTISNTYAGTNRPTQVIVYLGTATTLNFYRNRITDINLFSTGTSATTVLNLVQLANANTSNIYNNVIIYSDASGSAVAKHVRGIRYTASGTATNIWHNTIKLAATYTSGVCTTACFSTSAGAGTTLSLKNNVFQNVCSGGTGTHYAQLFGTALTTTTNIRNNYNQAPDANKLVSWAASDKTIATWRTAIGDGSNTEITGTITLSSTTGEPSSSSTIGSAGTPIGLVTTDFNLNSRSGTNPWIGAFEVFVVLPIQLLTFEGKKDGVNNILKWVTATELNNDFFTIEKTVDGLNFENIGIINGAGTSFQNNDYYLIDFSVRNEINYYRLKQTDFDGKYDFSELISIDNRKNENRKESRIIINILGQEVDEEYKGLIIINYTDGSSIKMLRQ